MAFYWLPDKHKEIPSLIDWWVKVTPYYNAKTGIEEPGAIFFGAVPNNISTLKEYLTALFSKT